MARTEKPEPLLHTPQDEINDVERTKLASNCIRGSLYEDFRHLEATDVQEETENLAKSHGIYLEYNRAKTGREKDWMFMVRISVPGGGTFNLDQWRIINDGADRYANSNPHGGASIRLTTRQNIQFHWVRKPELIALVRHVAQSGFFTLNGCGDNVRNVMGCPLSKYSDIFDANALAHQLGAYFRLPAAPHIQIFAIDPDAVEEPKEQYDYTPQLLNRKFKIGIAAAHRDPVTGRVVGDNCVELRTNDMGIAPVIENDRVVAYQVYLGGGQGEKNGKTTFAAMGVPFGVFTEPNLLKGLHDIVKVHEEWGDRKNRHWARLKYVIHHQGIDWYRDQVREKGAAFEAPVEGFDPGARMLHHGWHTLPTTGKLAFGAYVECGRLVDTTEGEDPEHLSGNVTGNGRLKSMALGALEAFPGVELMVTPNQDLLFTNIDPAAKEDFQAKLAEFGFGTRRGKAYSQLRVLSGACVGLPTCRLSYTDSEQFEPELLDQLDDMGYGHMHESIGITGCERQCFRPATKTFGWIGQGPDRYALKLGGSEDGRRQGRWLVENDEWYLKQCPRDQVAVVVAALFDNYLANRASDAESMGEFHERVGMSALVAFLKSHEKTAPLMEKTATAPFQPDPVGV